MALGGAVTLEPGVYGRFRWRRVVDSGGRALGLSVSWWCPGCEELHRVPVAPSLEPGGGWDASGPQDAPTLSPSLLSTGRTRCHSFLRGGRQEFLADCGHALAGRAADPGPLPPWA